MLWKSCYSSFLKTCAAVGVLFLAGVAQAEPEGQLAGACHPDLVDLWETSEAALTFLEELEGTPRWTTECAVAKAALEIREGRYFFALRTLRAVLPQLSAGDREKMWLSQRARLLVCLGLCRTGQWSDAVARCDRAGFDADLAGWVDYYGGVAAFRSDLTKTAVRRLQRAREKLSTGVFADSLEQFRTYAFGRLAGISPGFQLALGSSAGYDSNALMAPDNPALVGLDRKAVGSLTSSHWADLEYTTPNVGRVYLAVDGTAGRTFNYETPADSINSTTLGAGLSVRSVGLAGAGHYTLEGRYGYRITYLDGGQATLRPGLFGFNEAHMLTVGPSFRDGNGHGYSVRYSLSNQRFAELVRNGWNHRLSVGEDLALADFLSLGLAQSVMAVDSSSAYRRLGGSLGTSLAWNPASRWLVSLRGTGQFESYFDSRGYFSETKRRSDWLYVIRLEGSRQLVAGFSMGVYGGASGRHSTIEVLTYDKWEAGVSLTWASREL